MGVTHCGSTQKERKITCVHQSQEGEHSNNKGSLSLTNHRVSIAKKEAYSFLDGFLGYRHIVNPSK